MRTVYRLGTMTPRALVGSGCHDHLAERFFTRSLNHARGRAGECCSLKRATAHLSQGKPDHGRDPASGDGAPLKPHIVPTQIPTGAPIHQIQLVAIKPGRVWPCASWWALSQVTLFPIFEHLLCSHRHVQTPNTSSAGRTPPPRGVAIMIRFIGVTHFGIDAQSTW